MYKKRYNELYVLGLYLGDYNKRFYLREISKLAGLALKTTQMTLLGLENEKILKSEVSGKNKYFMLNLGNINTKSYIEQAELYKLRFFLEKYPLFKSFLKEINGNELIVIFGSFAKFEANKNSDVDILIVGDVSLPGHVLPYKLHKINLSEKEFKQAFEKETLIKKVRENHIILNNTSLFVNLMWEKYGEK